MRLENKTAIITGAFCRPCDRSVLLEHQALADRWGWDVPIQDIRRRLRCDTCGRRNQRLLVAYDQAAVPEASRFG